MSDCGRETSQWYKTLLYWHYATLSKDLWGFFFIIFFFKVEATSDKTDVVNHKS